jgi:zinc/manganese transport system substrate-binding protein
MRTVLTFVAVTGVLASAGCGSDDADRSASDALQIVVTTSVLGDIVSSAVGDLAEVEVIIPVGADSHDVQPSAKQAEAMEEADLVVVNGLNMEEGLTSVIDAVSAAGTPVFRFTDHVELLDGAEHSHDEEQHEHGGLDPHVWMDPVRMATAVEALGAKLTTLGLDTADLDPRVDAYVAELVALDAEVDGILAVVPEEGRVMVTNHEAFGYFADRYRFEILGAVVPSLTTNAEASARELEELAEIIRAEGVSAIFAETTESTQLAEAVAAEAGDDVEIVELFTESLGEEGSGAETYAGFMTTNATRIATALG